MRGREGGTEVGSEGELKSENEKRERGGVMEEGRKR